MTPFDYALAFLLVAGISFWVGRLTAPSVVHEATVNITLPDDSTVLAGLDLNDPAVKTATEGAAFRARVWLGAYEAAANNGDTYPNEIANDAVEIIFGR